MPDNPNLFTEEQLDKLAEQLAPINSEPVVPGGSSPSAPFMSNGGSTAPFFAGSLPPQFQLDSNFSRARATTDRIPKNSLMPFGPQGNPSINAGISSTAKIVAKQVVGASPAISFVGFTGPKEAVISGSPVTSPGGTFNWAWASELTNTVFAGPSGTASDLIDSAVGSSGNTPLIMNATATRAGDLALLFTCQDLNSLTGFNPGTPWSSIAFSSQQTVYTQVAAAAGTVSATGATGTSITGGWASVLALLTAKVGFTPTIVNHGTITSGAFNNWTNAAIGFTPTAGNTLIAFFMSGNTAFGGGGAASITFFADSQGDTWTTLASAAGSVGNGEQVIVLGASNIAGGATTFSGVLSHGVSNGLVGVIEVSNLAPFASIPGFRFLVPGDIPPISLNRTNVNGGVTGILGRGSLPAAVAYTDTANTFTLGQTISSTGTAPLLLLENGGLTDQINQFGQLFIRYDLFPGGGLVSPWTNYTTVFGGTSTSPIIGLAPAAGATGDYFDAFLAGSTTVKNFSIASSGKITNYGGIATVGEGVPAEYAQSDLTAQSAAITATTIYAVPVGGTGMYRISWSADITTADAVSSTLGGAGGFQVLFTSPTDSVVKTTASQSDWTSTANTTGTAVGGTAVVYAKASTNIQFTFGYTSNTPGQMIYELHIKVEAM